MDVLEVTTYIDLCLVSGKAGCGRAGRLVVYECQRFCHSPNIQLFTACQ